MDSCTNGGLCIQHANSIRCDCSLTTYRGPKCDQGRFFYSNIKKIPKLEFSKILSLPEGVSYKFGPGPGLIRFQYGKEDVPSRSNDVLVVGLRTNQTTEAIILRVDSSTSSDYLFLELVTKNLFFRFTEFLIRKFLGGRTTRGCLRRWVGSASDRRSDS